jgi:general secretion pathway protein A
MFLDFYHLREQPFGVTPDPRYLYFSPGHREALASLFYGIETGRGFLSLVAEPGMGKTTLLFQLLQRWKGYVHSAFLFQTQCDSRELISYLLEDLGLPSSGEGIVRMHSELNDFLYRETKAGRRVVLFIDEAQNLSDTVLETVRLLSNFEAPDTKLLQIVLAGQPELAQRLAHPSLAQLRQRISIQARLDALPAEEVARYVNHRLQVAGYEGGELFAPDALALIAERGRGIPRLINNLCFNSLSLGCAMKCEQINSELVRAATMDLAMDSDVAKPQVSRRQVSQTVVSGVRTASRAWYSRIGESLNRRWLAQTLVLSLLFAGAAVYFAARSEVGAARRSDARHWTPVSAMAATKTEAAAVPPITVAPDGQPPQQSAEGGGHENSADSFLYVVQPNDTLRDLCVSILGRYDRTIFSEIRKLNPDMKNPGRLEVGKEIRLPLRAAK